MAIHSDFALCPRSLLGFAEKYSFRLDGPNIQCYAHRVYYKVFFSSSDLEAENSSMEPKALFRKRGSGRHFWLLEFFLLAFRRLM